MKIRNFAVLSKIPDNMNRLSPRRGFWLLLIVACVALLPFLGLADFHTKGEPREAVVAYSMLESDDWVLPRNNGGDIPYKPPFFHWTIAAASAATGGAVSEFTSRLPSAVALIAMTLMLYVFLVRRKGETVALLASLVSLTAFELHRAGANCRVDMMLTALTVGALLLLYRWWERGLKGVPWLAILLMSCATLTKGPVGSLIPCLAAGVFLLLRGVNFFKAFLLLAAWGVMSFVLPLCWYYAAWLHQGQEFLDLVMEENFGRMTNTMSYDSCVNPWHYNLLTLLGGYVPWVLLVLISLFTLDWRRLFRRNDTPDAGASGLWQGIVGKVRNADPVTLFSAVCTVVIFLFYCFPQSKRSVYLMPIYPFIAYFLARYMIYLADRHRVAVKIYGSVLAVAGTLTSALFLLIRCGVVPEGIFHGRHAAQNIEMMRQIGNINGFGLVLVALTALAGVAWFVYISRSKRAGRGVLFAVAGLTVCIYMALDGAYQPRVLSVKSMKPVAAQIDRLAPAASGTLYEFIEEGQFAAGDPVHFFELDFYLGDRIRNFWRERPASGYLLVSDSDAGRWLPQFEAEGYSFTPAGTLSVPPGREQLGLYRFSKGAAATSR